MNSSTQTLDAAAEALGSGPAWPSSPLCRSCGEGGLDSILSLGLTPLANSLPTIEQLEHSEPMYRLNLAICPACSLVQILNTVAPEQMFSDYLYFSSFSDTMLAHARDIATGLMQERKLGPDSLVVEIASNDGYLLRNFVESGVPVLGIEPAANVAEIAREAGVESLVEFFSEEVGQRLAGQGQQADVMLANNVMAHVPDINSVVAGIKALLKPGGVFVMETPYVKEMIDHLEFDTIYHEHVFYYSLSALERLFQRHGLAASCVERIAIHGGSIRVSFVHAGEEGERPSVRAMLDEEEQWGVDRFEFYQSFAERVLALRQSVRELLSGLKSEGARVAAYGASAKGSTFLNFFGIGRESLDFVVDRSPYKQGRFMPGVHVPIFAPEKLLEEQPSHVLLLTWNFADEILEQQAEYRARGGKFILPIPELKVV